MHNDIVAETVTVNDTSLYYEAKGRGLPIVFISGGGILDRRGWDEQFEFFSKHYRGIRYDVRGIGKSARPQTPFSHSEDLYALLKLLNIERAHVVGLSVGGAIAIDFQPGHCSVNNSRNPRRHPFPQPGKTKRVQSGSAEVPARIAPLSFALK